GRQILDEVVSRHDRPNEYEQQKMLLVDQGSGSTEERLMLRFQRDEGGGEKKLLSVFKKPAGVKGTALLTWQHAQGADDQWLYLPSAGKRMKRIAKGGKRNPFMGTDYTYEDLVSESRDKFAYERQDDETLDGNATFVVVATPTDADVKKETGYKFRKMWIRQDIFFIVQVEFHDRRGRLIKRQVSEGLENVEGSAWRAGRNVMTHLTNKHQTIVEVIERSFDEAKVPARNFKQQTITSGRVLR
ncbi:MAG: outer membrane lipoprotein-sorting protein, partial [Gammaproteobacteria bacterium]